MTARRDAPDRIEDDGSELREAVRRRHRQADAHREPTLAESLSLLGALGTTIVLPTLAGIFGGRWLDHQFHTGATCTLGLLVAGLALGCTLAWRRVTGQ